MATLKFYLQQKDSKKNLYPIMMCYQDRGKKFRFFTKIFTKNEKWQKTKFKPVSLQDLEDNAKLDACKNLIQAIEKQAILKNLKFSLDEVERDPCLIKLLKTGINIKTKIIQKNIVIFLGRNPLEKQALLNRF